MDNRECFLILGIEPVKDEDKIKKAYRAKLAVTNPEDDPEGFKRLRAAYETACSYAQGSTGKQQDVPRDTTPSGLWVERADEIYQNIRTRQDPARWEELFNDEIFESLEEEENCRRKFLRFLMDHFRLPSDVWKLLDKKLNIVQDESALKESFPADFINYVCSRCERGEDIDFRLFEGADDADYDLFLGYYDNCWQALQDKNLKETERLLQEADGLHISHPALEICRAYDRLARDKKDEAKECFAALYAKYPDDDMVSFHTAETLWKLDERDRAAEIFLKLKEKNGKHYMANVRLTEWHYDGGRYTDAKKCAETVLAVGADDDFLDTLTKVNAKLEQDLLEHWKQDQNWEDALELGWCYLQDGAISRGLRLVKAIAPLVSDEKQAEYSGLMAKLYVEQAEYETAIAASDIWEKKLREKLLQDETDEEREKDEDRIRQAYMIRMQSYRCLGYKDKSYFQKAVEQIEAVETGTAKDIGLLLEKAQILKEMEEYERSLEIAHKLIEEYQIYAAAANAMDVYGKQWVAGGVVQNARICIQKFPTFIRAYEQLARVYLELEHKDSLLELLEEAEKNNIKSPYLEAYRYQLDHDVPEIEELNRKLDEFDERFQAKVKQGDQSCYEEGYAVITEYLYWYPCAYMLSRRAVFCKDARDYEKALADYEKALVEEPGNPYIHNGLSYIYRRRKQFEKALYHMKRAILYAEDEEWRNLLYCNMAMIYMLLGDNEMAIACFEHYDKCAHQDTSHLTDMAECLARLKRGEEAVKKLAVYYRKSESDFYEGYYKSLADTWRTVGDFARLEQLLNSWKQNKKIVDTKPGWLREKMRLGNTDQDYIDYFEAAAWDAMRKGDGELALRLLKEQIRLSRIKDSHSRIGLADMVFTAILYGFESEGRKYAKELQDWLSWDERKAVETYYDQPKTKLMYRFLANYYTESDEWLQELLAQESTCANCGFCLMPLCKELEGMNILLLMRRGRTDEAMERLRSNLEVQPYDEYMMAIASVLNK